MEIIRFLYMSLRKKNILFDLTYKIFVFESEKKEGILFDKR